MSLSDNIKHLELEQIKVPMIVSCSTLRIGPYLFYIKKIISQFMTTEKMIVMTHQTCFQKMTIYLYSDPAVKKKWPFF